MIDQSSLRMLSERHHLAGQIREALPILEQEFSKIQSLLECSATDDNFNSAIASFYHIFTYIPLMTTRLGSHYLYRARLNEKNTTFCKQTDISYNSINPSVIKAGRFNQPGQAAFYASLPADDDSMDPTLAACLETCKELNSKCCPIYLKDLTVGKWKVLKPFYVINLCFDNAHLEGNQSLKSSIKEYQKIINNIFDDESSKFIFRFLTYFSEMSGRKSLSQNEYYILTALFYAVKYYYAEKCAVSVHGLIFPSAMTEAKGLNIVLTPKTVDEFLELNVVGMLRFCWDGIKNAYMIGPCCDLTPVEDGEFNIIDFISFPQEGAPKL